MFQFYTSIQRTIFSVYFFERERERERERKHMQLGEGQRERVGERESQAGSNVSTEPNSGLELTNHEILT